MAGKPKLRLFHYDTKDNKHAYLGEFESQQEVFNMYYQGKNGRLFSEGNEVYREMCDGTYITKERIGRKGLYEATRFYECPFNKTSKADKTLKFKNQKGEVVAEFNSIRSYKAFIEKITNASFITETSKKTTKKGVKSTIHNLEVHYE